MVSHAGILAAIKNTVSSSTNRLWFQRRSTGACSLSIIPYQITNNSKFLLSCNIRRCVTPKTAILQSKRMSVAILTYVLLWPPIVSSSTVHVQSTVQYESDVLTVDRARQLVNNVFGVALLPCSLSSCQLHSEGGARLSLYDYALQPCEELCHRPNKIR